MNSTWTYVVVKTIVLAATVFHIDAFCSAADEALITETSLGASLITGVVYIAGAGVTTVGATQLIMAVGRTGDG